MGKSTINGNFPKLFCHNQEGIQLRRPGHGHGMSWAHTHTTSARLLRLQGPLRFESEVPGYGAVRVTEVEVSPSGND